MRFIQIWGTLQVIYLSILVMLAIRVQGMAWRIQAMHKTLSQIKLA